MGGHNWKIEGKWAENDKNQSIFEGQGVFEGHGTSGGEISISRHDFSLEIRYMAISQRCLIKMK